MSNDDVTIHVDTSDLVTFGATDLTEFYDIFQATVDSIPKVHRKNARIVLYDEGVGIYYSRPLRKKELEKRNIDNKLEKAHKRAGDIKELLRLMEKYPDVKPHKET